MTPAFLAAWEMTGREEGGYVDHPSDTGGATNHGITERVSRAHGYVGDMRDLSLELARQIAKAQYWDLLRLDDIAALSLPIALELFDSGFNVGQGTVARWLQRCLNALNRREADYEDVNIDGLIGPMSVAALRSYLAKRGTDGQPVMLRALNSLQGAHYIAIAESRDENEDFLFGWLRNRVTIKHADLIGD